MGHQQSTEPVHSRPVEARPAKKRRFASFGKRSSSLQTEADTNSKTRLKRKLLSRSQKWSPSPTSASFSRSVPSIGSQQSDSFQIRQVPALCVIDDTKSVDVVHSADSALNPLPGAQSAADYERFFVSFHQKQQRHRDQSDHSAFSGATRHRVAFVSVVGLFHSFRRIPTHILFSSLFVLSLRRQWLYDPLGHAMDARNVLHSLSFDDDEEFMQLLRWKDSQGLLFFMATDDGRSADGAADIGGHGDADPLPLDLGIDGDSSDDEEDDAVLPVMDAMDATAFEFAANISIASPTHSLPDDLADVDMERILESHRMADGGNGGAFSLALNLHEVDMAESALPSDPPWNEGPDLPLTPSVSGDALHFVPPLRLQRDVGNGGRFGSASTFGPIAERKESDDERGSFGEFDSFDIDCDFDGDGDSESRATECDDLEPCTPPEFGGRVLCGAADPLPPPTHSVWERLSSALTAIYDPFAGSNFEPLLLDRDWWTDEFERSQYGVTGDDVASELSGRHIGYRAVMEILFQSNPSLIPCKTYRELENVSAAVHAQPRPRKLSLEEINLGSNDSNALSLTATDPQWFLDREYSTNHGLDSSDDVSTLHPVQLQWVADDYDAVRRRPRVVVAAE